MLARAKGAAPGTFTGGRIVNIASMAGLRVLGADRRVLHEQGGGGAHDARDGAGVGPLRHQRQRDLPGLHRHRDQPPPLADRAGQEADRHAAAQARRPAAGPGRGADDAVRQREPLHQRRGDPGRRRLRASDAMRAAAAVAARSARARRAGREAAHRARQLPAVAERADAGLQPEDRARPGAQCDRGRGAGRGRCAEGAAAWCSSRAARASRATSTTWAARWRCRRSRSRCWRC